MIIEVSGLEKNYPAFRLDGVSFGLERGRIAGFVGRNGAGKTTTIKSMLGLAHPDGGSVRFFGIPLEGNETAVRKRIGYSAGTVGWYPRKRIGDIIDVVKRFYDTWDEAACRRYLDLFEIDPGKTPRELSEGMKVKFSLLLALSHRAEALILDEPTSGLDPFSRNELLEVFSGLKKEGTGVFFSTHIISDIEKCADDIVFISKGRIAAAMPKADFVRQYSKPGETLEDTMLRMEGGADHA